MLGGADVADGYVKVAANQRAHALSGAFIADVFKLKPERLFDHRSVQVRYARQCHPHGDFAGMRLGIGHEFFEIAVVVGFARHQILGRCRHQRDRVKVVPCQIGDAGFGSDQQTFVDLADGIAVRCAARRLAQTNGAANAGHVDDGHFSAKERLHVVGHKAHQRVRPTTGRPWYDEFYSPFRVGFGSGGNCKQARSGEKGG